MKTNINFIKYRVAALIFSLVVILVGVWFLAGPQVKSLGFLSPKGLNLGIDFQSGSLQQVTIYSGIPQEVLRNLAEESGLGSNIQEVKISDDKRVANETSYLIKTMLTDEQQKEIKDKNITVSKYLEPQIKGLYKKIDEYSNILDGKYVIEGEALQRVRDANLTLEGIKSETDDKIVISNVVVGGSSLISPGYSKTLRLQALLLVVFVIFVMLLYITIRFKFRYGVGAVAALIHDVLIVLGFIAIIGLEFNYTIIAAILFIIGYSLNDTIVIFDRIRENYGILKEFSPKKIINVSINQSLSRTFITSFTTLLSVIALYVWGGGKIQDFALILMVGIFSGTYSSVFIAAPVVDSWERLFMDKKKRAKLKEKERDIVVTKNEDEVSSITSEVQEKKEDLVLSKKQKKKLLTTNKKKKK